MADTDQFMSYYKNITFDQFMSDITELFDPNVSIPNVSEGIAIDRHTNTATVSAATEEAEKTIVNDVLKTKMNEVEKLTLNNHTYDITTADDLAVRNAIDSIPKVSFLLSNILIKSGEV